MVHSTLLFSIILLSVVSANETNQARNLRAGQGNRIEIFSDTHFNTTLATPMEQNHRRTQQSRTILVLRIVNNGNGPTVNNNVIRQYVFSDPNSLKAQMMKCSSNAIIFNPAPYGAGGVVDVPVRTTQTVSSLINAAKAQAPRSVGVTDLRKAADHVMFILPKVDGYFAEAEVGSGFSYYNDEFGVSLGVLLHEVGHNLGQQFVLDASHGYSHTLVSIQ